MLLCQKSFKLAFPIKAGKGISPALLPFSFFPTLSIHQLIAQRLFRSELAFEAAGWPLRGKTKKVFSHGSYHFYFNFFDRNEQTFVHILFRLVDPMDG